MVYKLKTYQKNLFSYKNFNSKKKLIVIELNIGNKIFIIKIIILIKLITILVYFFIIFNLLY